MTVKELKEKLNNFDENLEIRLTVFSESGYNDGILNEDVIDFYSSVNGDKLNIDISTDSLY